MRISTSMRWLVVAVAAAILLAVAAACGTETVEVPGETVVVEKEVIKEVEVPGETVVVKEEVVKTVEVPGPERVVVKEVQVPGKKYVTDPTNGKVVSAPEYGGSITYPVSSEWPHTDTFFDHSPAKLVSGVVEKLGIADWATPRDEHDFVKTKLIPESIMNGHLAESWEISPDRLTYTFHIRKGVRWHNKPPMNGRELTADDVVYNFHRYFGNELTGSPFSEAEPTPYTLAQLPVESITATDKWTVVFKLNAPNLSALMAILQNNVAYIYPPEVIEEHGDVKDWRNLVGTGPYEVTDYVEGSSATLTKNSDYWGYDEKYPQNRLPYIDEITILITPEPAARLAGLRAAKFDALGMTFGRTMLQSPDQVVSIQQTNPELVVLPFEHRSETSMWFNVQKPPFDDISVRHAMQMALDLETIDNTYWKGWGMVTPQGYFRRGMVFTTPFEEWSEELQGYYTYDPAGAEALLDEAGLPRGADGIRFKTVVDGLDRWDLNVYELLAEDLGEIGIDVEYSIMEGPVRTARWQAGEHEITSGVSSLDRWMNLFGVFGRTPNAFNHQDTELGAMIEAVDAATTWEEHTRLFKEVDMYITEKHWILWGGKIPWFNVLQPWVIGYNGEWELSDFSRHSIVARLWIDSQLKEAMGH